jgi:ATP synthase F1 delta subunit
MTGAKDYAQALFSLSEELGTTDAVISDVEAAAGALKENPSYAKLCDTPAIPVSEKLALIKQAFGSVNESVRNLLCILCESHSVRSFPAIAKEYVALYNESRGIIIAEAVTAVALTAAQTEAIKKKLEAMTGKTVRINNTIDKSMIGGIRLRYLGTQLDSSLTSRLASIEKALKNAVIS